MTVTDKDAKDFQKMVDKLEKQNKKDKNKETEASIGSFFKSCLSTKEKEQLKVVKKDKEIKEKQTLDNTDQV